MKKLLLLSFFTFQLITSTAFSVCENMNFSDESGTAEIEEMFTDAIMLSAPPSHLSAQERQLYPYLEKLLDDLRGEEAARKVISHFDRNNNGTLDSSELDYGFKRPPFEFGFAGRKIGIPVLLSNYGSNNRINIEGARRFVSDYGF